MSSSLEYRNNIIEKYNITNENNLIVSSFNDFDNIKKVNEGDEGIIYNLQLENNATCILKVYKTMPKHGYSQIDIYEKIIKDIIIHNKVKILIMKNICPNFIYYYYSNLLATDLLINRNIQDNIDIIDIKDIFIVMEYCDGSLIDFFETIHPIEYYESLFFQICVSVLCMQRHLNMLHNDLSISNILYKKIRNNTILQYNINDISYCVPTFGYLFLVIDFEKSILVNTINDSKEKQLVLDKIRSNYDFHMLLQLHHRPIKAILRKNNITKHSDLLDLVKNKKHLSKINKLIDKIKKSYNYKNNKDSYIKDKILYSSILHFMIDNDYLDIKQYVDDDTMKIIDKIKEMIDNIFSSTNQIETLLEKYYKQYQTTCKKTIEFNVL